MLKKIKSSGSQSNQLKLLLNKLRNKTKAIAQSKRVCLASKNELGSGRLFFQR
jgi:hypothetical protein